MDVRQRFTLLYVALFLVSGAALLALTNVLALGEVVAVGAPGDPQPQQAVTDDVRVAQLQAELRGVREERARQLLAGSAVALAVMGGASVVLGRVVAGRVLRPLAAITAATRRISADNLHERLAVPGPADEVKDLADTVDGLLERLEGAFEAQRRFVANAAHELRTPLATMRAVLDVAVAKPEPVPAPTLALADRLRAELDQVDRLLDGFLELARAQHGAAAAREPVALRGLVLAALDARATAIAAKGLTVEVEDADVWTRGSPTLLARLVGNVVDNGVAHNQEGGWIRVGLRRVGTAELVVETGGPVLDPAQVARLGAPFARLGPERTGSGAGTGLGLSIVAAIASAHGGRLELRARPRGGLRLVVALPLAPAAVPA